jgi:proteasome lid subunit RPN8/RPN11
MNIFGKKEKPQKKKWKIKSKCLDLILECAKSNYPNEFGGLLSIDMNAKDTITELVILPGTIMGESHALFKLHMKPVDFSIVGTVHSHPSYSPNPSGADYRLFRKHGRVHIIAAMPFDRTSWKAYDSVGEEIEMSIV